MMFYMGTDGEDDVHAASGGNIVGKEIFPSRPKEEV